MALQVWLPLIKDTNNYGCSKLTSGSLTSNSIVYENGKIGKAIRISNYATTTATYEGITNITKWSISLWLKLSSSDPTPSYQDFFTLGINNDGATNAGFRIEHKNVSGTFQIITTKRTDYGSNTNGYWGVVGSNTLSADKWAHIVITNDGINYKTYFDGVLTNTTAVTTFSPTTSMLTGSLTLGQGGAYCWLNDLRIYDHCLTPKEVKEISKGLVVHYPLNDQYAMGAINKYSDNRAAGESTGSSWTRTKLVNERGYNYKGTYTGTGSNAWWNFSFPVFTFTVGKKYYYSLKCRCNKFTNTVLTFRAARSANDYGGTMLATICSSALADGQWHEYVVYQTINETYDRGGTTVTCAPLIEAYTGNMNGNGTIYEMDFDLKDIQVVESDTYVPFIENTFANDIVYDTSGFRYNGKRVGSLSIINDSPRYNCSTLFGSSKGIYCTPNPVPRVDGETLTVSCWFKQLGRSGYQDIVCDRSASSNFTWLLYSHTTDGSIQLHGADQYKSTAIPSLNEWHHVAAVVYTNQTYSLYLDGIKVVNAVTYKYRTTGASDYLCVGKYGATTTCSEPFNGYISDVRIYATALSDADILELYQKPVSINQHSMMTQGEYIEQ